MNLLRPELRIWLTRWAESLAAGGLAVLGVLAILRGFHRYNQVLEMIGLVLVLLGGAVFWAAFQRARFARAQRGPGLVEVDERQIRYLTSYGGDTVDLAALTRLELRSSIDIGRIWVLKQAYGPTLFVPTSAAGADKLFDAFLALPEIDSARLVAAINAKGDQRDVIWRAPNRFRVLT